MSTKLPKELSVNNPTIDGQHQKWLNLLDDFYNEIKGKRSKETLEQLLLGMLEYTRYHFTYEEKHMEKMNYPELESHKAQHAEFLSKMEDYYERLTTGKLILSVEVTNYLKSWLIDHIKGEDQLYAKE